MTLKSYLIAKFDKWFPPIPEPPQPAKKRPATKKPAPQPIVTYEAWRDGRKGLGPKVAAPKGKGKDWAARLYCENQINRAKYYQQCDHSKRQLRTGSHNYNRRRTMKKAHAAAWGYGIEISEHVYNNAARDPLADELDGYWQGVKEIVQEAFGYTSYMLELAGD